LDDPGEPRRFDLVGRDNRLCEVDQLNVLRRRPRGVEGGRTEARKDRRGRSEFEDVAT
jgi:hypothetical protein